MNSRTRRQTRQSNDASQSAATTRTARVTRSAAHAQQETERTKTLFRKRMEAMLNTQQLTQEDHDRFLSDAADLQGEQLESYVRDVIGDDPLTANRPQTGAFVHQQRAAQMMQSMPLANVAHPGGYPVQRMMTPSYGMTAMPRPGMPDQGIRPLGFGPFGSGVLQPRMHPDVMRYPMHQRPMPRTNPRQMDVPSATGEVAKTLIPNRSETQPSGYPPLLSSTSSMYSMDYRSSQTNEKIEAPSAKRIATHSMESTAKVARTAKSRRAMEDPSAPDANEMDVVTEAAIDVEEEQEALLNDVPSQVLADADGQSIDSDVLNTTAIRNRLQQLLREQGMQSSGIEVSDMVLQGMEERFEAFLKSVLKRSMHRSKTDSIQESEMYEVSSDVRSKLREIKKKQEQHKMAKLREEREKLEQLAETASKKELANNKELAAKVERVKKEKQFNAEAEAANRALSNALGDLGFDRIRRRKQDKQAKESSAPRPPQQLPPSFPKTHPAKTRSERPVVVKTKDIISVMTEDPVYAFSSILYRLCL